MPLNDLVKDYSLTTISQKTNIPIEVLEKLLNKEWESLQATKAKGFIAIIEREFGVDLSELKEEANEYYSSHKKESPNRPIDLVDAQSISGGGGRIISNIVAILTIGLVAYAGWFYFVKPKNQTLNSESNSSGLIKESIEIAKDLVGIDGKKESEVNSTKKKEEPKEEELKAEPISTTTSTSNIEPTQKEEIKSKKFDITAVPKSSREITNEINTTSTTTQEANNKESATLSKIEENKTIKASVDMLLEENRTTKEANSTTTAPTSSATIESSNEDNLTIDNNTTDIALEENATLPPSAITIKPNTKRIWVGFYNLKTKKRTSVFAKKEYTYNNPSNGDVVIVTGHSMFDISTDNEESKHFAKKGKRYLLVSKDGIKELTRKEYRELTKRRAW